MAKSFNITSDRNPVTNYDRALKGETLKYSLDFSPWVEDAGVTLTSATWTVRTGTVAISSKTLTSNVASGNLTFSDTGRQLIEVDVTDGTITKTAFVNILVADPYNAAVADDDYGMVSV